MGSLTHFDIPSIVARYGILHFVETGTGVGAGLMHAARFDFRTLRSCDLEPSLAASVGKVLAVDSRVSVSAEVSEAFLRHICTETPRDEPILFWLDAHFPGADYGLKAYGHEVDETRRLPLRTELEVIRSVRAEGSDVVLVDDLRIWTDGGFGSGNLPANVRPFCPKERDASFFVDVFGTTHDVRFDWSSEGYVVITPREKVEARC